MAAHCRVDVLKTRALAVRIGALSARREAAMHAWAKRIGPDAAMSAAVALAAFFGTRLLVLWLLR